MSLRNRLAAIFSPTRRLADDQRDVLRAGGAFGGVEWVVPRADCQYRRLEFPGVPARQRDEAARIAVNRLDAQSDAPLHVAWTGPVAHAWTWTAPPVDLVDTGAGWIPESRLRPVPPEDGLRLLAQVRGVEGQYWRDGVLQASRWWPRPPTQDGWLRFARGCGLGPEQVEGVPPAAEVPWADPWGDGRRGLGASPAMLERWGWRAAVVVVLFVAGWQVAAETAWSLARQRLDARMAELRSQAAPLLAARERAELARAELDALLELRRGPPTDYVLMADVVSALGAEARLSQWQRQGSSLRAVVGTDEQDPRRFVTAYSGHPQLANVVVTPVEDGIVALEFELPAEDAVGTSPP